MATEREHDLLVLVGELSLENRVLRSLLEQQSMALQAQNDEKGNPEGDLPEVAREE